MNGRPPLDPDLSIGQVMERHPALGPVLHARGIDTCCGGVLTLRQAAEAKGLPLAALMAGLEAGRAEERRSPEPGASVRPGPAETLLRRFVILALSATLIPGTALGLYNLLKLHLALGPVPPSHLWLHGGAQLFGFVLPFIVGISLVAVPRLVGAELRAPRLVGAIFWALVLGLVTWVLGASGFLGGWGTLGLCVGAILEVSGVAAWALILGGPCLRARGHGAGAGPFLPFLGLGALWWALAAGFLFAGGLAAERHGTLDAVGRWSGAFEAAALYGGGLSWIEGMFLRVGPVHATLPSRSRRVVWMELVLGQLGVLGMVIAAAAPGLGRATVLQTGGLLAVASSAALCAAGVPLRGPLLYRADPLDRSFPRSLRVAFGGAWLFAGMAVLDAGTALLPAGPPPLLRDGMRHVFALGFVAPLIFAMAGRILPSLRRTALRTPRLLEAGVALMGIGALLRLAEVPATLPGAQRLLLLSAASGVVAAAGVVAAILSLAATLAAPAAGTCTEGEAA